jgi:putative DNA-invertase from lambdoid prophage Rac
MPIRRASAKAKSGNVFGQARKQAKMFRAGLYARVSTNDQQTLPMQNRALREYAARRGWTIALQVREVGSGAAKRQAREKLLEAARRREIDVVLVWRLDRWGRSVTDLLATLQELEHLGVGFVSLTEALDLTTPAGRAMASLLAIFAEFEREILRERTRAGLAQARLNGKRLGRPETAGLQAAEIRKLYRAGASKSEIARRLEIGRTSVRRILADRISGDKARNVLRD